MGLVAEEAKPNCKMLGRALAEEHHCSYIDITMPLEERNKRGIDTSTYDRHPVTRAHAYIEFERYMFDRIKSQNAVAVLIMCGRYHFMPLAKLFMEADDDVSVYDTNEYKWHRGVPIESDEGVVGYDV